MNECRWAGDPPPSGRSLLPRRWSCCLLSALALSWSCCLLSALALSVRAKMWFRLLARLCGSALSSLLVLLAASRPVWVSPLPRLPRALGQWCGSLEGK